VVLPFDNLSTDPEQAFFADGITEEITAALGKVSGVFVIARNTAFTYKDRPVKVQDVGRELGVRYVLEGSVRTAGDRVRVTAQLIEAATEHHIWSEQYDRELEDIFSVQSEISGEILTSMQIQIRAAEAEQVRRIPTRDLTAYEAFLRGRSSVRKITRQDNEEAHQLFQRAIDLDPNFAAAHGMLAATLTIPFSAMWTRDLGSLDRAETLARKAISIDPREPIGHSILATILFFRERLDEARVSAQVAAELAPGDAELRNSLAMVKLQQGSIISGLNDIHDAVRLDPHPLPSMLGILGALNFRAGNIDAAVDLWERSRSSSRDLIPPRLGLAHYYGTQNRNERSRELIAEVLRTNPALVSSDVEFLARGILPDTPEDFLDTLRAAGLPDEPKPTSTDLSGRPSIIVLPFDNLSGDPEQAYFADGITEDLTTALSSNRALMVLSPAVALDRASASPRQLHEEFGVRYVVEGTVRRAAPRIRITVKLTDATTGAQLWAEAYDRELSDLFALQSEIARAAQGRLNVEILEAEQRRPTNNLNAYDAYIRARGLVRQVVSRPELMEETRRLAGLAAQRDPEFAEPHAILAMSYVNENVLRGFPDGILLDQAEHAAKQALRLDPHSATAHNAMANVLLRRKRYREAMFAVDRSIELSPSYDAGFLVKGLVHLYQGQWAQARHSFENVLRLNPQFPPAIWSLLGCALYHLGEAEEGTILLERSLRSVRSSWSRLWLMDYYESRGRHEAASRLAREVAETWPELTAAAASGIVDEGPCPVESPDQMLANLRKAGLP
jgi:TolB-like protein/Tfp pilus assembly protein PilF